MKRIILITLFFTFYYTALTQIAKISFSNKTYANETIYVLKEKDFITKQLDTIAQIKVDNNGHANISIHCKEPFFAIIPLYKFQAWFCVEPNKEYKIFVPNKTYLNIEDSLNAYFTPIEYFAQTIPYDSSVTQNAIIELNFAIDTLIEKHIQKIRYKIKRKYVDSLLQILQNNFSYCKSKYFKDYLYYKIAWLKYFSYERDANYVIKQYFSNNTILLNNTAYTEFFDEIFKDYLSYYATTRWGENVFTSIAKAKSPFELRKDLRRNPAFINDTLIDLVILKGLHDAYYTNNLPNKIKFPVPQIIMTLDSLTYTAKTDKLKQIAKNILQKLKEEEISYLFENIPLYDFEGNEFYLRNFKGKFLYVTIMDFRAYNFLLDQKKIKAIFQRFSDKMNVVNVVFYPQKDKLLKMINDEKLHGIFLFAREPEKLKKQLKLYSLPSFYIYSPIGAVISTKAPPPDESMLPYFIELLK